MIKISANERGKNARKERKCQGAGEWRERGGGGGGGGGMGGAEILNYISNTRYPSKGLVMFRCSFGEPQRYSRAHTANASLSL